MVTSAARSGSTRRNILTFTQVTTFNFKKTVGAHSQNHHMISALQSVHKSPLPVTVPLLLITEVFSAQTGHMQETHEAHGDHTQESGLYTLYTVYTLNSEAGKYILLKGVKRQSI